MQSWCRGVAAGPECRSDAPSTGQDVARRSQLLAWLPLILVLVMRERRTACSLVVPYYVNDLDQLPAEGGRLWGTRPEGPVALRSRRAPLSAIWAYGALFMFMFGFLIAFGGNAVGGDCPMWRDRRVLRVRERCALAMALLCGVALHRGTRLAVRVIVDRLVSGLGVRESILRHKRS